MKELSIEQKAKKYDEAYKVAENIHRFSSDIAEIKRMEEIFPELKESEDKKIKDAAIEFVRQNKSFNYRLGISKEEVIAWIEKQGEKPQGKSALDAINEEKVDNANKIEPKDYSSIDPNFGKPIEQKSADKVEPKFKVGDWILIDNPCQIKSIDNNGNYIVRYCDAEETHLLSRNFCDSHFHLWTIQDAKEGDVLALDWKDEWKWQKIVIFKSLNEFGVEGYGNTFKNNRLVYEDEDIPYYSKTWTKGLYPATKEQRDTLMKAMADAGYTFDSEKKELKKIEQNPAWCEEDDYYYGIIQYILNNECVGKADKENAINWFKSLKDRVQPQPKQEMSEEDSNVWNRTLLYLENMKDSCATTCVPYINECINWIKSLRPQNR